MHRGLAVLMSSLFCSTCLIVGGVTPAKARSKPAAEALRAVADAYLWANRPTAHKYVPSKPNQWNSTGATNTVTREGRGSYLVDFAKLGSQFPNGGTVDVTTVGKSLGLCTAVRWNVVTPDIVASVMCWNHAGVVADTQFSASFTTSIRRIAQQHFAYAWADQPVATVPYSASPFYQYDAPGGTVTVNHVSLGRYIVLFPLLRAKSGTVKVTSYGSTPAACSALLFGPSFTDERIDVACTGPTGDPVDTRFTVSYVEETNVLGDGQLSGAYIWAHSPGTSSYAPIVPYQYNSSGHTDTVRRLAAGKYVAMLPDVAFSGGNPQVVSSETPAGRCQVVRWATNKVNGLGHVYVDCFTPAGKPADSRFLLQWVAPRKH